MDATARYIRIVKTGPVRAWMKLAAVCAATMAFVDKQKPVFEGR